MQTVTYLVIVQCLSRVGTSLMPVWAEWHSNKTYQSMLRHKCGFVPISIGDSHWPVDAIRVQWQEIHGIIKQVDTFVHAWYGTKFPNGYCIHIAVVHAKAGVFRLSWLQTANTMRRHILFWAGSITSIATILSISYFSNFWCVGAGSVRCCMDSVFMCGG